MKVKNSRWLFWLPRILGILMALFITLFALDVFDGSGDWGKILTGFIIHLLPTFILAVVLLIAWRWELTGGILYFGLAGYYIFMVGGKINPSVFLVIPFPLIVVGALFIVDYFLSKKGQTAAKPA